MNLQKHVSDRSVALLKGAKAAEVTNQRALLNQVVERAIKTVDEKLETDVDSINEALFESALLGIRKGSMTYENDLLLPLAQATIREEVMKITSLSDQEQLKLVELTENQLNNLKNMDESSKKEFLETAPKLDGLTMGNENYKKMAENWGR